MSTALADLVAFLGSHPNLAIAIVFVIAFGEALFVVGLFVPSTVVLVGAGALVGSGALQFWPVFVSATLGAVGGDAVSYWIGHTYKYRITRVWPFSKYTSLIDSGQSFFARHGAKSVFIARFIPAVKSILPGIAGMMGMNAITFTIINVISAIAWSLAHLLPGIGVGRGIARYWQANPRLVFLLTAALVLVVGLWYLTKILIVLILPRLNRLRHRAILRLSSHHNRYSRFGARLLHNDTGLFISFTWAMMTIGLLIGFSALLLNVLFDPELSAADQAIKGFLQTLRNTTGDTIMVAVTMMGDARVLAVLAVLLLIWIFAHREWKIGASVALAICAAAAFVPAVKSTLQRARPSELYSGAEAFSFPSGHATLSATILGVTALILVHHAGLRIRLLVYFCTLVVIASIALSRVYLGAHWPSDVVAGVSFGLSVVAALAFFLQNRRLDLHPAWMAALLLTGYGIAYGANYSNNSVTWTAAYAFQPNTRTMTRQTWLDGGFRSLPAARITFEGEPAEPFRLQVALPVEETAAFFEQAGWREDRTPILTQLTDMALPSRRTLQERAPLPRYHDGRAPVLTLVRSSQGDSNRREVLRLWRSDVEIVAGDAGSPEPGAKQKPRLLIGSTVQEIYEPIAFGYSELESQPVENSDTAGLTPSDTASSPVAMKHSQDGILLVFAR